MNDFEQNYVLVWLYDWASRAPDPAIDLIVRAEWRQDFFDFYEEADSETQKLLFPFWEKLQKESCSQLEDIISNLDHLTSVLLDSLDVLFDDLKNGPEDQLKYDALMSVLRDPTKPYDERKSAMMKLSGWSKRMYFLENNMQDLIQDLEDNT